MLKTHTFVLGFQRKIISSKNSFHIHKDLHPSGRRVEVHLFAYVLLFAVALLYHHTLDNHSRVEGTERDAVLTLRERGKSELVDVLAGDFPLEVLVVRHLRDVVRLVVDVAGLQFLSVKTQTDALTTSIVEGKGRGEYGCARLF